MYSIETAKMSSKGQLVMPDLFRKRYGWTAGMTLLLIGTGDSVVVQSLNLPTESSVKTAVTESHRISCCVANRLKKAKASLDAIARLGITLPENLEKSELRRSALAEKYA